MGLKVGGHKGVCPRAVNHFSHALCSINYSTSSKKMGIRSLLDTSFINLIIHTYVYVYFQQERKNPWLFLGFTHRQIGTPAINCSEHCERFQCSIFRKHNIFINHIFHNFFCRSFTPCSTKIRKSVFEEYSCRNGICENVMYSFLKMNISLYIYVHQILQNKITAVLYNNQLWTLRRRECTYNVLIPIFCPSC